MSADVTAAAPALLTVDPAEDPRWARLVERERSDVFHSPAWCRVLRDTYGFALRARLLVGADGEAVAGFAYGELADAMDPRLVSLPFSDFCDPIVGDAAAWHALVDDLVDDGNRMHLRCVHNDVALGDARFDEVGWAWWHGIDLPADPEQLWSAIDPAARRSIRKARAAGVEVRAATTIDDVRTFFRLHLGVRKRKYGLVAQPWSFFANIWEHLLATGDGALLLAHHDGAVVGGVLYLQWGDTLYYKFNASDADHLTVRPNDLVVWHGIEHACSKGLRRLDFGVSDWEQDGLVRYKRKYANCEAKVHFLRRIPGGAPSAREAGLRATLNQLTGIFVDERVPDDVTEQAGDVLYRYFT